MIHANLGFAELSPQGAVFITRLVRKLTGISIPPEKTDLLHNRLAMRLRALNLPDFDSYVAFVQSPDGAGEIPRLLESMTTHTTSFFREDRHYRWLSESGLPALLEAKERREISVWSAACSTGAELWSAAMTIDDFGRRRFRPVPFRCIGTDISRQILARAEAATYTADEIEGIPETYRRQYLLRSRPGRGARNGATYYRIMPEMRQRAAFLHANLTELDGLARIEADIVFLRNVLIYFERDVQKKVVAAVTARIRPGGYLLTGHAEALLDPPQGLVQTGSSIYRKTSGREC